MRSAINFITVEHAKPKWYEQHCVGRPFLCDPRDYVWWWQNYWRIAGLIYECLIAAGMIEIEEGGLYRDARIAPLGTKPPGWLSAHPKPWWLP